MKTITKDYNHRAVERGREEYARRQGVAKKKG